MLQGPGYYDTLQGRARDLGPGYGPGMRLSESRASQRWTDRQGQRLWGCRPTQTSGSDEGAAVLQRGTAAVETPRFQDHRVMIQRFLRLATHDGSGIIES